MSFLHDIRNCKKKLNKTETVVTCVDGKRYVDKKCGLNGEVVELGLSCGYVVDTAPDDVPALIIPHLFLGSQDCCSPDVLTKSHIQSVLSLGIEAPYKTSSVEYTFMPCLDLPETDLKQIIIDCNKIIRLSIERGENILVHCNAGVSRSVSVIIGYLIIENKKTYDEAYDLVKSARPCVKPNDGFVRQLKILH